MEFEFDPAKSESNKQKHGIDFAAIQELWLDPFRLMATARTTGETRFAIIGRIGENHWTCIFTIRGERVRIISARKARDEEKAAYYHDAGV